MPRGQYTRRNKKNETTVEPESVDVIEPVEEVPTPVSTRTVYKITIHYVLVSKDFESRDLYEIHDHWEATPVGAFAAVERLGMHGLYINQLSADGTALYIPPHRIRQVNVTRMEIPDAP